MSRTLTAVFRRAPSRDKHINNFTLVGYSMSWPDGRPVAVGLDAFCHRGQRLLGIHKLMAGCDERKVTLVCASCPDLQARMLNLPGSRVRRFCLCREGRRGRLHFMDGTPTSATFDLDEDEQSVLDWIGLPAVPDGGHQWVDVAARAWEEAEAAARALARRL
jgi:hypothetical protein